MNKRIIVFFLIFSMFANACQQKKSTAPTVAFIDAFQDNTIAMAKQGFFDALKQNGFDEKSGTLNIIYRNAQGDIPTLTQIAKYMIAQQPSLIATCPSIATITAVQNTSDIPVFMMVSPNPNLMNLNGGKGNIPSNLFGTGENIDYIDTSFGLIPKLISPKGKQLKVGMIFNQSEPQSVAAMNVIKNIAVRENMELVALPVNSSAEVLLVTQTLLSKNVDAFFANPDNTVFASFESIVKACDQGNVPIMTSEAGLVSRGALAAYGADMYQWGFQTGLQAAQYLKTGKKDKLHWEVVKDRERVYNKKMAEKYHIMIPSNFKEMP
jgi:putative ABC transport system substrate-binding protein